MKSLLLIYCLLPCLVSNSQDTVSIEQFDSLVVQQHIKMENILNSRDTLMSEEAVILIKIENTILYGVEKFIGMDEFNDRKKKYINFDSCFSLHFIKKVIMKLDARISYGLGWYSEKYDIMLGGNMTNPKNWYYIEKK